MTSAKSLQLPDWERWVRIEQVFHRARTENGRARADTLDQLCAGDDQLKAEVQALLDADEQASSLHASTKVMASSLAGRRAGNYRLDCLLGSGGMGSVYLAHRCDGQFDRQVALKVLGGNLRDEFFTERFAIERQLLADLAHPNIAGLLDSGVSNDGDPYLVLEYVDGTLIDQYCDDRQLTVNERIRLFMQVCTAVEFAHSRRVIHRDLKPPNVLVTHGGTVKLLDFGTAKLLEISDCAPVTTRFRMMTPRYASPEQLRGEPLTASTDVYSLGILLYELLTGAWPFGDSQSVVAGLERAVREVEPRHPKAVIDEAAAARRGVSQAALIQTLNGDLWKVISKAIQVELERRYGSAEELAEDLERYLSGKPVLARPQTLVYRTSKFARRNRSAVALALAFLAIVGALLFWRLRQGPPATIAVLPFENLGADPKNQYFSDGLTDEITDALTRVKPLLVISRGSSFQFRDKSRDVREVGRLLNATNILEGSVQREDSRIRITARLLRVSDGAQLWSNLYERPISGLFSVQAELASSVAESLRAGAEPPNRAKHVVRNEEAVEALMRARFEAEQFTPESFAKAEQYLNRAIQLDPEYASAYAVLGATIINKSNNIRDHAGHQKMLDVALPYYRKALELDPDLVTPRCNLAGIELQQDWNWNRAEREYQRALARGPNAAANSTYGLLLVYQGRFQEADEYLRLAQEQNPYSTTQIINIISARILERRFAEARALAQSLLGRSPNLGRARAGIDWTYVLEGHPELALADYAKFPQPGPVGSMAKAQALARAGQRDEGLKLIRPMEDDYRKFMPAVSFATFYALLGDEAASVKWLERAADDRDFALLYIGVDSAFDRVRNAPGFQAVLKRIGLAR